jgi:hypothetical protein
MAQKKADDDRSLKRLGGGRWQTRDERFTIEPQSGTWVLVDAEQTDDLGLPLVRGPYRSLTEAKVAVEAARGTDAPESPLADRVKEAGTRPKARTTTQPATTAAGVDGKKVRRGRSSAAEVEPPPEPAPEPRWIKDLASRERGRARRLIEQLDELGVGDAESLVRQDLTGGVPRVARLAAADRLVAALPDGTADGDAVARVVWRVIEALDDGRDEPLGVRWRLVDGEGRPVGMTAADLRAALRRRTGSATKEEKR